MVYPNFLHQFKALESCIFVELETVKCKKDDIVRQTEGGIES
jgi:hypothetical protein